MPRHPPERGVRCASGYEFRRSMASTWTCITAACSDAANPPPGWSRSPAAGAEFVPDRTWSTGPERLRESGAPIERTQLAGHGGVGLVSYADSPWLCGGLRWNCRRSEPDRLVGSVAERLGCRLSTSTQRDRGPARVDRLSLQCLECEVASDEERTVRVGRDGYRGTPHAWHVESGDQMPAWGQAVCGGRQALPDGLQAMPRSASLMERIGRGG
jgi:hypothetical protein